MKKVLIVGVGAQGSTVAQRLEEEPYVEEIICADYDEKAVNALAKNLKKARGVKVDGNKYKQIAKAAKGVDLIVNALPLEFGRNVLEAALEVKANYQDFGACTDLFEEDGLEDGWLKGINYMYDHYGKRFAEIGKLAIIGTGAAPGLICVAARRAVRELDSCDTINTLVYEGIEAKRFLPIWFAPQVALADMSYDAYAFEHGQIIHTESFGRPIKRKFPELDNTEVTMYEHAHDEPVFMGRNAEAFFKGVKNIYFKYGGVGMEFGKSLYRAGLLSQEEEIFQGRKIVPFDFIMSHMPPPPKFKEEIQEILEEGLISDTGALVVEAYGKKEGKKVMVDLHVFAPGMAASFDREGITAEMYLTGQCGFFFTKMLLEDMFTQQGLISTDMLTDDQVDHYLDLAAGKDITYEILIQRNG